MNFRLTGLVAGVRGHQQGHASLVKLAFEDADTPEEIRQALALLEKQDDSAGNVLAEMFSTHPMIIRRIQNLRDYTRTSQYARLQEQVNQAAEKA